MPDQPDLALKVRISNLEYEVNTLKLRARIVKTARGNQTELQVLLTELVASLQRIEDRLNDQDPS